MTFQERFESKVHLIPFTTCHIFESDKGNGYGRITFNGRREPAHRVAYKLYVGEIPEGMHILHSCDEPGCVNPDHLRAGTHQDNMNDKVLRGRCSGCNGGIKTLSPAKVIEIRELNLSTSQRKIALMFGISQAMVSHIVLRKKWARIQ